MPACSLLCPQCGVRVNYSDHSIGTARRCEGCGIKIVLPHPPRAGIGTVLLLIFFPPVGVLVHTGLAAAVLNVVFLFFCLPVAWIHALFQLANPPSGWHKGEIQVIRPRRRRQQYDDIDIVED